VNFKLVAFDLDGVLVEEPSAWWTLHHAFGTYEASKENLRGKALGSNLQNSIIALSSCVT
jgi:phosphoserine phosphatase